MEIILQNLINASRWFVFEEGDWVVFTAKPKINLEKNHDHNDPAQIRTLDACRQAILPFAWVAWHSKTNQIRMARDHFGQVPLFYCYLRNQDQFIFAGSIKEILDLLPTRPNLTDRVVIECFTHQMGDHVSDYSTETFFENIYRVTPGCITEFKDLKNNKPIEIPYWELDPNGPDRCLSRESDYHEYFAELLKNTVKILTPPEEKKVALEFSGGLDSSSILIASREAGLEYGLLTHSGPDSHETSEYKSVQHLVKKYGLENKHQWVDASDFDPIDSLIEAAKIFPGGSPYLFFPLANNIHEAASKAGYQKLVSGFGGDECISSHAGYLGFVPDMLRTRQYRRLWEDWRAQCRNQKKSLLAQAKSFCFLFQYSHPVAYQIFEKFFDVQNIILRFVDKERQKERDKEKIKKSPWMASVRHRDYAYLQGHRKHTTRMRVEYSALVAQKMDFEYCYPFLSWPLVEFCFYLPAFMKRRNGEGRYLIWEYFSKHNPDFCPDKRKMTGSIMPGTFAKCQEYLKDGRFAEYFKDNPYGAYLSDQKHFHIQTIEAVHALMWKAYLG